VAHALHFGARLGRKSNGLLNGGLQAQAAPATAAEHAPA